ncbi:hypothetical protein EYF80_010700 [Liparis tanakae]|uniref:Uncharacterized protein n=1 Tax=Liparis tanakae TaxID=230148 RepID=A0A4Z2IMK7_9TELE|nr:hypothetical protein EYF80_010700 [Liparis tanakae]
MKRGTGRGRIPRRDGGACNCERKSEKETISRINRVNQQVIHRCSRRPVHNDREKSPSVGQPDETLREGAGFHRSPAQSRETDFGDLYTIL